MLNQPTPTATLDPQDVEPWITFLVERLGNYWPWIQEATPSQIKLLSGAIAAIINRIISRRSLHTEIERVAIEQAVEEILHTMKPERVQ